MAIKISDIPLEGLTLKLDQALNLFEKGRAATECTAVLSIKPARRDIFRIQGRVQAVPLLECSRCLKNYSYAIDAELNLELAPLSSLEPASEHELGKGELDIEFYEGNEIEPLELVREHLLIALPMVPLHHPDCKGLCSICGTDLNAAECGCRKDSGGAFSALKDVLKK